MKEVLKNIKSVLKEKGFKGSAQNYYCETNDVVFIVNFQKSTGIESFYINLGVQPKCLIDNNEYNKVKEYECSFRSRVNKPDNTDYWPYSLDELQFNLLINQFQNTYENFLQPLSQIREIVTKKNIVKLLKENNSIYGTEHASWFKLYSELSLEYGCSGKSIELAKQGIALCPDRATSLLDELKQLAHT